MISSKILDALLFIFTGENRLFRRDTFMLFILFFVFSREDQIDERKIHNRTQKSINLHIFFIKKVHACLTEIWFFSITIRIENNDCNWTTAQFHNRSINSNKLCKSTDNLSLDHLLIWWTPSLRNFVTKRNSLNMWNS